MKLLARVLGIATLGVLLLATPARAHFGGAAYILVPADHVNPGEPFEVVVADLTPGSSVVLEVRREGSKIEVGRTVSDTQGHFSTMATLPGGYPHGYTELIATADDGTTVSTFVLVGPRDSSTGPPPAASAGSARLDPSVVVLAVFVVGSMGALGYILIRRRQAAPAPVPQHRVVPRKRPRKRSAPG